MNKPTLSLLLPLLLSNLSLAQAAEEIQPQYLQQIEALQSRADKLAFSEPGANNYHLAKVRTWLNLALSEYHEKDSSGILSIAVAQAETLLEALDKKQTDITAEMSMDTLMQLPGSETVHPDLWDKIAELKGKDNFVCGQRQVAEAEVFLVWAGYEKAESGWSHAKLYANSAENLIYEAQAAIDNCAPAALAAAALPPVVQPVFEKITLPAVAPPAPPAKLEDFVVLEKVQLSTDALFAFGDAKLNPASLWRLNKLADTIKSLKVLNDVLLVGHTDRMRGDGHFERNQILSEQRAESIKQYLIGKGVAEEKIHASGVGSEQPLVLCSNLTPNAEQVNCLRPNRRVEIILRGVKQ